MVIKAIVVYKICTGESMLKHMSDDEYHEIDACSASGLKTILYNSPAYYQHKKANPAEGTTPAKTQGTALHLGLLQPDELESVYLVIPPDVAKSYSDKAYEAAKLEGKLPLLEKDYRAAMAMVKSVRSLKAADTLLDGEFEQVCLKEIEGVPCKAKFDIVNHDRRYIVDPKTCISIAKFEKSFFNPPLGYQMQAAWYSKVMLDHYDFVFIAIEKEEPYGCALYKLSDEAMEFGIHQITKAFEIYKECYLSGVWPGHSQKLRTLELPRYLLSEMHGR